MPQSSDGTQKPTTKASAAGSATDNQFNLDLPICALLVDDQAMIGEAVRRILLTEKDISYHYCPDPTKVFDIIKEVKPTVILQDLVMPNVNGLELLKEYRANPETAKIPVIVLSTREEPKVKAVAQSLGANDYLVKLPDKLVLISRIRYHSKAYINQLQQNSEK